MEPMYMSIKSKETGDRIRQLLIENGYTVRDVQEVMGFENPQAVYKWLSGKSLPSLDNLLILSKLLNRTMEEILVVDGDFHFKYCVKGIYFMDNIGKNIIDWEASMEDGRFTEPSDGKVYRWREMIEKSKVLGRPLTDEEAEEFRVE